MKKLNKILSASTVSIAVVLSVLPVMADDTDIFVNQQTLADSRPNILFITDNSGSMSTTDVTTFSAPYDSSTTYSGSYVRNSYYYGHGANPFATDTRYPLATSINYCKDLPAQIGSVGKYEGDLIGLHDFRGSYSRYARYSGWWDLKIGRSYGHVYTAIECLEDYAKHGSTDGSSAVYPTKSRGNSIDRPSNGWVTNANNAFNYSSRNTYGGIYSGNYINYARSTPFTTTSRMDAVKSVLDDLIGSMNNVNFGLMSFNVNDNDEGGVINYPVSNVATDRAALRNMVANYQPRTWTPLGETLYEAVRYFKGDNADFGRNHSVSTSMSGSNYISPIENECQANAVIFLTDGLPSKDTNNVSKIEQYLGNVNCPKVPDYQGDVVDNCLAEAARYMANNDLRPDLDGKQTAKTFTVGFKADFDLLADTATAGNGSYYTVESAENLATSIRSIVEKISQEGSSFTAPGISVNFFGSLQNNEEIYYSLFQPESSTRWAGNLKRFKIALNNEGNAVIYDATGKPAINDADGKIHDGSKSFWSSFIDGAEVAIGGAAEQQTAPRNVFTYIGNNPDDVALAVGANRIVNTNTAITEAMLGAGGSGERTKLLSFAQGYDVNDELGQGSSEPLLMIGDPLHSQPTVLQYKESGTHSTVVFFGTNEGYLHAIDASNGREIFGFMPQELLPNLKSYLDNGSLSSSKPYGLDGEIELWVNDLNGDGYIRDTASGALQSGESAYLFVGMRRGGKNFYALDVSDVSSPRLMWKISKTGDFSELGQTWTRPQIARVRFNGIERAALVIGGGYDDFQDGATSRVEDSEGRAIYVIDALTGEKLWSAGHQDAAGVDLVLTGMVNSIAAPPGILDSNSDGFIDTLIAPDTAGRIWRIDIKEGNNGASDFATGSMIADLSKDDASNNRRFFASPDLIIDKRTGFDDAILVSIGSGRRTSPLEVGVQDRYYTLRSSPSSGPRTNASGAIVDHDVIKTSDLFNATNAGSLGSGSNAQIENFHGAGFYINMQEPGEKILGETTIFGGYAIFTTYVPNTVTNQCGSNLGSNNAYIVNLADPDQRVTIDLSQAGIAPKPSVVIMCEGDCNDTGEKRSAHVCVGTECLTQDQVPENFGDLTIGNGSRDQLIRFWMED